MQAAPPPIRVIAPGAAYRRDELDATHSPQFHQIEGLYVDENVSVADLKGALEFFMRELFGSGTAVQFRPHYLSVHRAEPRGLCEIESAQGRRAMDRSRRLRRGTSGGLRSRSTKRAVTKLTIPKSGAATRSVSEWTASR